MFASRLFSPYSDADLESRMEGKKDNDDRDRGGVGQPSISKERVDENEDRSIKNHIRLEVIDERTAWIMRLLVLMIGVLITAGLGEILIL